RTSAAGYRPACNTSVAIFGRKQKVRKILLATLLLFTMGAFALSQTDKKTGAKPASGKNTEQALKDIEDKWAAASLKSDADTIGSIVADDWTATSAAGKVQTKAEMLS